MVKEYFITTDKTKIDYELVFDYLSNESYWAKNIPYTIFKTALENSICFSVFDEENQIAFARVVTDRATFGYISDVFVLPKYRGKGIGKILMQNILENKELQGFRSWLLSTRDAHGLYEQFDFILAKDTTRLMRKQGIEKY